MSSTDCRTDPSSGRFSSVQPSLPSRRRRPRVTAPRGLIPRVRAPRKGVCRGRKVQAAGDGPGITLRLVTPRLPSLEKRGTAAMRTMGATSPGIPRTPLRRGEPPLSAGIRLPSLRAGSVDSSRAERPSPCEHCCGWEWCLTAGHALPSSRLIPRMLCRAPAIFGGYPAGKRTVGGAIQNIGFLAGVDLLFAASKPVRSTASCSASIVRVVSR